MRQPTTQFSATIAVEPREKIEAAYLGKTPVFLDHKERYARDPALVDNISRYTRQDPTGGQKTA